MKGTYSSKKSVSQENGGVRGAKMKGAYSLLYKATQREGVRGLKMKGAYSSQHCRPSSATGVRGAKKKGAYNALQEMIKN